jgi:TonB family protein
MSSSTIQRPPSTGFTLQSELYRACLPQSTQDPGRKLIWMNTVCAMFMTAGVLGIAHPPGLILQKFQEDQVTQPIEILQTKQEDKQVPEESKEEADPTEEPQQPPTAVQPVVVAAANADVAFAVEVKGPVIVSKDPTFSVPPPRDTRRNSAPTQTGPIRITGTGGGDGSFFPKPSSADYPRDALVRREQGSGEFLITVGPAGELAELKVNTSSGSPTLDLAFRQWIRKYYKFGPEYFGKQVIAEFEYKIR